MARKPSPAQLRALRDGAAHPQGRISPSAFQERTIECLVGLNLADWEARIGLPTVGVITAAGRAYLAQLDGTTAPAPIEVDALHYERRQGGNGHPVSSSQEVAYYVRREVERAQQAGTRVTVDEHHTIKIHSDNPVRFFPQAAQEAPQAPAQPQVIRPYVPGKPGHEMGFKGSPVSVHYYPATGTAYCYAGTNTLGERTFNLDTMPIVTAQQWAAECLTAAQTPAAPQEAPSAPQDAPENLADRAARMTPADVTEAVRKALGWLTFTARRNAEGKPASVVLAAEVKRTRRVMRRALAHNGPEATMSAISQHEDALSAHTAALRLEKIQAAAATLPGLQAQPLNVDAAFPARIREQLAAIMAPGPALADELALIALIDDVADALHMGTIDFPDHDALLDDIRAQHMTIV